MYKVKITLNVQLKRVDFIRIKKIFNYPSVRRQEHEFCKFYKKTNLFLGIFFNFS